MSVSVYEIEHRKHCSRNSSEAKQWMNPRRYDLRYGISWGNVLDLFTDAADMRFGDGKLLWHTNCVKARRPVIHLHSNICWQSRCSSDQFKRSNVGEISLDSTRGTKSLQYVCVSLNLWFESWTKLGLNSSSTWEIWRLICSYIHYKSMWFFSHKKSQPMTRLK
jgi:hypothetical protein